MNEAQTLIFVHITMVAAVLLPIVLMKMVDLEKPNKLMGYRTPWSLKSNLTWKYANQTSANYMMWSGLATISAQVITYVLFDSLTSIMVAASAMMVGIAVAMVMTEIGMRKKFNKDGTLKNEFDDLD